MCFKLVYHVCFTWSVWSANKIESTSGSLKVLFWNFLEIFTLQKNKVIVLDSKFGLFLEYLFSKKS